MKLTATHIKYLKIGGGVLIAGVLSFGIYKLIIRDTKPDPKKKEEKEEKKLQRKVVHLAGANYVNVRSSPQVDNTRYWKGDFKTNLLAEVDTNPVGEILARVKGSGEYYWYKLKLNTPIKGKTIGYVREDVVVVQKED